MDVKNIHSATKTEISVFGRQALDAERRRSPSLADKVLTCVGLSLSCSLLYAIFYRCLRRSFGCTHGRFRYHPLPLSWEGAVFHVLCLIFLGLPRLFFPSVPCLNSMELCCVCSRCLITIASISLFQFIQCISIVGTRFKFRSTSMHFLDKLN